MEMMIFLIRFDFNVVWMLEWDEKWKVYLLDHSLNWIG